MDVMEFVGVGSDQQLWTTARDYGGGWPQPAFEQPPGGAGPPGFQDVYGAGVGNGVFQLIAIGLDGKLWHTLRDGSGNWQPSINPVSGVSAGGPTAFSDVGCAGDGSGGLNVVGVGSDGQLWHTARRNDGSWFQSFDRVSQYSGGGPGSYRAVAAAGSGGPTQVIAVGSDGRLWHTIRNPNNTWQPTMGSVASQSSGGPAAFTHVACSGDSSGGLNIVALGSDNQLWHTARRSNGSWFANFTPVSSLSPGLPATVRGVGAGNDTNNDMQVIAIGPDGALWHSIRHNNGQWQQGFGRVPTGGGPPQFTSVTAGSGAMPPSKMLNLTIPAQEHMNWCWVATGTGITSFYDQTFYSQCSVATIIMHDVFHLNPTVDCCATPFNETACDYQSGTDQALDHPQKHWDHNVLTYLGDSDIMAQIDQGHPVAAEIAWTDGERHEVAITGYTMSGGALNVYVQDPALGPSWLLASTFRTSYQGNGTWVKTFFSHP